MMLLDRYLFGAIARATLIVMLVLLALIGFVNLAAQLDDVGVGRFGVTDAILVVVLTFPTNAFDIFPMAVLLGSMLGLGTLANRSELVVIRAAGVSTVRLALAMFVTGCVLALAAGVLGEIVGPPAERFKQEYKAELKQGTPGTSRLAGTWLRDGPRILNILQVQDPSSLAGVFSFEFDETGQLRSIGHARSGRKLDGDTWRLEDFVATRVDGEVAAIDLAAPRMMETQLAPEVLEVSIVEPSRLSTPSLSEYIDYLRANDLAAERYELALWSRWANACAVILMVLLALPFVFGPLRSGGNGVRMVIGVLIGVTYFLATGALTNSAAVYDMSPLLAAWLPLLLLSVGAAAGLARIR